jgi:hypothetical protein
MARENPDFRKAQDDDLFHIRRSALIERAVDPTEFSF